MSEQSIMVCVRVDDAPIRDVAGNSVIANCSECDARIWISKASQDQMVEQEGRPVCMRCFKTPEDSEFIPPTKEVMKEILEHMKIVLKETKDEDQKPTDRLGDRTTKG